MRRAALVTFCCFAGLLSACLPKKESAKLIAVHRAGEPVFASEIEGLRPDGGDLLIGLTPAAHARLARFCAETGDAPVRVLAAGRLSGSSAGCKGLEADAYRFVGAARYGSPLPDRLDSLIALQPPGSRHPVLTLLEQRAVFTLNRHTMAEPRWGGTWMAFTPTGALSAAIPGHVEAGANWILAYDNEVLGGWNRIEASPQAVSLRTTNAPAMQAWRAFLEG
jgi:hypothetical protein